MKIFIGVFLALWLSTFAHTQGAIAVVAYVSFVLGVVVALPSKRTNNQEEPKTL